MFEAGLVDEVKALVARGYGWELPAMSAIGYRQVGAHLRGEITLEEAERQMRRATRRLVRQQASWFKPGNPGIRWFQAGPGVVEAIESNIRTWIVSLEME